LEDVRRAGVRFAAECLAFSHIPSEAAIEELLPQAPGRLAGHHPLWKAGIPRENEADWDFEDVRDHYLKLLFGVDAGELRWVDRARYLELSRALTGEILAEVFGEWRRAASPCGGGLVLWLHDLLPGAGWGLIDHRGRAKLAYHHLKRALAPIAVWTVDENLGGVVAHVANDGPTPLIASLRVALYREHEHRVGEARVPVALAAHGHGEWNVEAVIGQFVDAAWAYRFGPPAQDAIVVTLEQPEPEHERLREGDGERKGAGILSQAVRFPAGRPLERESPERLGLTAQAQPLSDGSMRLALSSRRLAYGVEIHAPGFLASDDGFSIEPGGERLLTLLPGGAEHSPRDGSPQDSSLQDARISAMNMSARVKIAGENGARST
jgi:beta-mannosidase